MKKLLCILLSVVLIAGTGVISANAVVDPEPHRAEMTLRLREELLDESTDTVQVIFYLTDYSPMWEDWIFETVIEKYNCSTNEEFQKCMDIERSKMIAEYNYQFCYDITEDPAFLQVEKVIFSSRKDPLIVVEAKKEDVGRMSKHYTDVEKMDLYDGSPLPNGDDINSPFKTDFEAWTYINYPEILEQDPDEFNGYPLYTYKDLYIHNARNEYGRPVHDWVLCQARYNVMEPEPITEYRIGGAGGRLIIGTSIQSPFDCGYGIFDVEQDEYYGLEDIADDYSKYDGLLEALAKCNVGVLLGDVNGDNTVDILDATIVQKNAVDKVYLDENQKAAADINGDYLVDVFDTTEIQKFAVI